MFRSQDRHHEFVVEMAGEPRSLTQPPLFSKAGFAIGADRSSIVRSTRNETRFMFR
jgi:hypothetical protein